MVRKHEVTRGGCSREVLHQTLESPPFTHLSKSSEYVPGIVLSAWKTAMTKIHTISCSYAAYSLVETDNEQINKNIEPIEISTLKKKKSCSDGD